MLISGNKGDSAAIVFFGGNGYLSKVYKLIISGNVTICKNIGKSATSIWIANGCKVAIEESSSPLKISGNPFSNTIFQLSGGNPNLQYTACLTASDGRIILQQEGTVGALNQKFKQLNIEALSSGIYILKMQNQQDPSNVFKLVKQ